MKGKRDAELKAELRLWLESRGTEFAGIVAKWEGELERGDVSPVLWALAAMLAAFHKELRRELEG